MENLYKKVGNRFDFQTVKKLLKGHGLNLLSVDDLQKGELYIPSRKCNTRKTSNPGSNNTYHTTGFVSATRPFVFLGKEYTSSKDHKVMVLIPDVGPVELVMGHSVYFFDATTYPEVYATEDFVYTDGLVTKEVADIFANAQDGVTLKEVAAQCMRVLEGWYQRLVVSSYELYIDDQGRLMVEYLTDPEHPWKKWISQEEV